MWRPNPGVELSSRELMNAKSDGLKIMVSVVRICKLFLTAYFGGIQPDRSNGPGIHIDLPDERGCFPGAVFGEVERKEEYPFAFLIDGILVKIIFRRDTLDH